MLFLAQDVLPIPMGWTTLWGFWRADKRINVYLSPAPIWGAELECGRAQADVDLSDCKMKGLLVKAGASSIILRLGSHLPETRVQIEAGVSSVPLEVPRSSGCEIRLDVPLTSRSVPGFVKEQSGLYRSENFDRIDRKIFIEIVERSSNL